MDHVLGSLSAAEAAFASFATSLAGEDVPRRVHDGLIGLNARVQGPFGERPLVYADYVASGRALAQVERFIMDEVLPYYANSHTEGSYCGSLMTRMRGEARRVIGRLVGADMAERAHAVVFTGSGATAGLNRLVHVLGVADAARRGQRPVVLIGPYEHHSNILPWRESGAEVIEIPEAATGGPDLAVLQNELARIGGGRLVVGSFSAASNVSGIVSDVVAVTGILKAAGALAVWDYAGGGPYLAIRMTPAPDAAIDAIVVSPHKFAGGPGASGVMVVRRDAVRTETPSLPGGGTVRFVSPWGHVYSERVEVREEGGTPNVIGDIRAALVFMVKDALGQDYLDARHADLCRRAFAAWGPGSRIEIMGKTTCRRLPIFSFRVHDGKGGYVHQQLITRVLSDAYGIQARGGCACAGPYGHRLFNIDRTASDELQKIVLAGHEVEKLGFVRLNLSALATDAEVDFILSSVKHLADHVADYAPLYRVDERTATFSPAA
jgi:selenocysteine lyase/cysteine desulfurase